MPGRKKISIKGIVQGVGFRPFVYRLAKSLNLKGFVRNTTDGVEIEIEGADRDISEFIRALPEKKPPAARIDSISTKDPQDIRRYDEFSIVESKVSKGFTQISPDIATCSDCLGEMADPQDRRYAFAFINCTNCGPRFSIITETPYDRARTSMRTFKMCTTCTEEFHEVSDRRFHAQPDCCHKCGPEYRLFSIAGREIKTDDPIGKTAGLIKEGEIVAIKGIGGFHIACDAQNCKTVARLRELKNRPTKPLAVMARSDFADTVAQVSNCERKILESPVAPIMLLKKRKGGLCENIAPKNPYLGIMFPYAPVHHLLLREIPCLVMTSGNIQDEPIAKHRASVTKKLRSIVSFYLDHDRNIENRNDDSIGYYIPKRGFSMIRRSRGYVPIPIRMPISARPTLAVGPFLKNTFTLARRRDAYVSPHIGDLDNLDTMEFFEEMVAKYRRWFRIDPRLIVHDLHPDYLSTKIAKNMPGNKIGVQHHVAHFVSCLAENNVLEKSIGIIFDGTGYGSDGKVWGGEFFIGDIYQQRRAAHLQYLPLPGGESSINKPYRIAVAYVHTLLQERLHIAPESEIETILRMIDSKHSVINTSSMGRLFDCVSAMLGITTEITYEAEAAINLEHAADPTVIDHYPYSLRETEPMIIEIEKTLRSIRKHIESGIPSAAISARFHRTIGEFSYEVADRLREKHDLHSVCLSGGVFQNRHLLSLMIERFEKGGFKIYTHRNLPTNDGCISYGQVIAANAQERSR
ncbi:MAG: carbamoyltransferase HypF [candidate division WOR-3 bacterium]|nr:MAG: carbamoyltransferase HypF [candidate division WOR-3 bacterium]